MKIMNSSITVFFISIYLIVIVRTAPKKTKDLIGFPEIEENPLIANKQNRTPVYIPAMCPDNELLYPGYQADDWICDCRPAYIYHPPTDACWLAYQKGPCPTDEYLILPSNSVQPTCVKNPCKIDSSVMWKGNCETLGAVAPCGINKFPLKALWINTTTLNIECVPINVGNRFSLNLIIEEPVPCAPGSKRYVHKNCDPYNN